MRHHQPMSCSGSELEKRIPGAMIIRQYPGETVVVPSGWSHMVVSIGQSLKIATECASRDDVLGVAPARHREEHVEYLSSQEAVLHLVRAACHDISWVPQLILQHGPTCL
jgi:oxalate decarboxylase/phosphoglucose isomerase-like protein (cupin superfamily)